MFWRLVLPTASTVYYTSGIFCSIMLKLSGAIWSLLKVWSIS